MKRQDKDDAQQFARVAAGADLSKWPGLVLKLDLGQVTANEVMVAADQRRLRLAEVAGLRSQLLHRRGRAVTSSTDDGAGAPQGRTRWQLASLFLHSHPLLLYANRNAVANGQDGGEEVF